MLATQCTPETSEPTGRSRGVVKFRRRSQRASGPSPASAAGTWSAGRGASRPALASVKGHVRGSGNGGWARKKNCFLYSRHSSSCKTVQILLLRETLNYSQMNGFDTPVVPCSAWIRLWPPEMDCGATDSGDIGSAPAQKNALFDPLLFRESKSKPRNG